MTRLHNGLFALLLSAMPAGAGEPSDFNIQRQFELPAHRALARVRADSNGVPTKFTTDGCSGGLSTVWSVVSDQFPEFSKAHGGEPPWEKCCVVHDIAYHSARGSAVPERSFANRAEADQALRTCVVETGKTRLSEIAELYGTDADSVASAYRAIANAMYLAVRLGGGPCSGMPWRWGYGYRQCFVNANDLAGRLGPGLSRSRMLCSLSAPSRVLSVKRNVVRPVGGAEFCLGRLLSTRNAGNDRSTSYSRRDRRTRLTDQLPASQCPEVGNASERKGLSQK